MDDKVDKDLVEHVTKIVLEKLAEVQKESAGISLEQTTKIWPHQSPLPDPIIMEAETSSEPDHGDQIIAISPYR